MFLVKLQRLALQLDSLAYLKLVSIQRQPFTDFSKHFLIKICSATMKKSKPISLGLKLVRMAHSAWLQSSLAPVAVPFIDDFSAKVGETVHLAELDNGQVLYVDKRNPASPY